MPGRGWPDGFYELAPEILTCDLYLNSKSKMDCTVFFFSSVSPILVYMRIFVLRRNDAKKVQSILHLEYKYKSHVKISDANS